MTPAGHRRAAIFVLLLAALLWTGWGFFEETADALGPAPPAAAGALPSDWRLGSPQAAALAPFLERVDRELPPGSTVAVAPASMPDLGQDFFLYLWYAYHLPRHDVLRASQPWTWERADYVVTYRLSLADDQAWSRLLGRPREEVLPLDPEPVVGHPLGAVYRVRRP